MYIYIYYNIRKNNKSWVTHGHTFCSEPLINCPAAAAVPPSPQQRFPHGQ